MQIDRIVTDVLEFINSLLWWRAGKISDRPYELVGKQIRGYFGILQRIKRHPIPGRPDRYVDYWIFSPFPHLQPKRGDRKDIHIICSWIGVAEAQQTKNKAKSTPKPASGKVRSTEPTHQIDIIEASHWINKRTGNWDGIQIYTEKVDLIGRRNEWTRPPVPPSVKVQMPWADFNRDGFAIQVSAAVAHELLTKRAWSIQWSDEIDNSRKAIMGSAYPGRTTKRLKGVRIVGDRVVVDPDAETIVDFDDWLH